MLQEQQDKDVDKTISQIRRLRALGKKLYRELEDKTEEVHQEERAQFEQLKKALEENQKDKEKDSGA